MADRHDPIEDDRTPNKRQKLNPQPNEKAWDSQEDSAEEFNEDDFHTVATIPIADTQKRKLGYSAAQMNSALNSSVARQSSQPVTQPTQTLKTHVTQPTQPVPSRKPEIQVGRSSPLIPDASPPQQSQPQQQPLNRPMGRGILANVMAPPGTAFKRPVGVRQRPSSPVVGEGDSDDDPPISNSSPGKESQGMASNIKPTNFKKGSRDLDSTPKSTGHRSIVQETPRTALSGPTGFDKLLSGFAYQPGTSHSRPSNETSKPYSGTPTQLKTQQPLRQNGPGRAIPAAPHPRYRTEQDISIPTLREKVIELRNLMGKHHSIDYCVEVLERKKGHLQDAMEYIATREEAEKPDELASGSPLQRKGIAQTKSHTREQQPPRPSAKQGVAASRSIAEKYKRGSLKDSVSLLDSDEDEEVKPRSRLVKGKITTAAPSSPPSSPPAANVKRHQRLQTKQAPIVDLATDDESGVEPDVKTPAAPAESSQTDVPRGDLQKLRDERLLKLINECTTLDLAELCGQPEDKIQFVLNKRPFNDLEEVSAVAQENRTKSGKVSKKSTPVGERLVDDCREVMTGYDAIDELVVQCENLARPLQEALRGWGVGDTVDGELQLMSLEEAHDSGIGTPSSSVSPEDHLSHTHGRTKQKNRFITQPPNMSHDLIMKNYQLVGLNWLYLLFTKNLSCILADDMGLGKTCQIIGFLSYLQLIKTDGVHLVIVPGSTLENWLREFGRFAPDMNVRPYYGSQAEREELRYMIEQDWCEIDAIVTTYDMAVAKEDNHFLRKMGPFSVCVYDEAHALRNPGSQRYKQLTRLEADFKVLLTGTPLQNNLQELVAILAFIMPRMFSDKEEDLQYIFKHKASTKDTASAALLSNDRIARARTMMTPFILRRKKAQVLDLPTKSSRIEYCDMTDDQANFYADTLDEAQRFFNDKAVKGTKAAAKKRSNVLMSLRKAAIHPLLSRRLYDDKVLDKMVKTLQKTDEFGSNPPDKIRAYLDGTAAQSLKGGDYALHKFCYDRDAMRKRFALKHDEWMDSGKVKKFEELVTNFARNGDRVLVFSQFTTLMDILEAVLESLHIKFMRLDGSTRMDTRQDMIDKFYEDESITCFMLSTRAGGAGINLAAANKVIIFDSGFNPQDDIQAENRAHRVGQTRPVEVVRLVSKGTIEEQIHALGESKLALDERVAGEGSTSADMSAAETAGEQMVEQMLVANMSNEDSNVLKAAGADLKDAFKNGLESEGLKVASKQAQF